MKKILLSVMLIGIFVNAHAQFIEQGSIIANGTFSFYSTKYKESNDKYSSFSIMPWAGFLVMDNLAVGGMIEFSNSVQKSDSDNKITNSSFIIGPVIRYYLDNGLFFQGDLGLGSDKNKFEFGGSSSSESTYNITQFRLGVGYAIRITETVFFDPVISYKSRKMKDKDSDNEDTESGLCLMASFTIRLK